MGTHQHILLATDFTEYENEIADKANALAKLNEARLSIIHVVDNLPICDSTYGPVIPYNGDLTEQLMESAKQRLNQTADKLDIPKSQRWIEMGSPKLEIVRVAEENQVDLIVLGSHGRHGLALLLGSTANGVLHHATCDVLAVRLQDN